jgi:hypothetical protein
MNEGRAGNMMAVLFPSALASFETLLDIQNPPPRAHALRENFARAAERTPSRRGRTPTNPFGWRNNFDVENGTFP